MMKEEVKDFWHSFHRSWLSVFHNRHKETQSSRWRVVFGGTMHHVSIKEGT